MGLSGKVKSPKQGKKRLCRWVPGQGGSHASEEKDDFTKRGIFASLMILKLFYKVKEYVFKDILCEMENQEKAQLWV